MQKGLYKLPSDLSGLLRSEWDRIIEEAGFNEVDEGIVRDCILDKYTQAYAASGVDRTRCTVSRRMPKIIQRAREVATKLNMIQK
jgi:hypothetical protein